MRFAKFFSLILFMSLLPRFDSVLALEIIGHRGASHDAPENTLRSFRLGYEQKADAVELDIHLTRDGKIVVMHDPNTRRTGGLDKKISELSFEEIRKLNIGNFGQWKSSGYDEKVPFLDEVLRLIPDGRRLFIEIKTHPEILPELGRVFQRSDKKPGQLPIITFYYDSAREAKKMFPQHEVSLLYSWARDKKTGRYPDIDELIQKAKAAGLDGLDLQSGFPIDQEFVAKVHQAGLKLYTWTVDDADVAQKEKSAGVDGITTNRPGWLRQRLAAD
jgi:glycerophosphoryl diester phosphodiesterase